MTFFAKFQGRLTIRRKIYGLRIEIWKPPLKNSVKSDRLLGVSSIEPDGDRNEINCCQKITARFIIACSSGSKSLEFTEKMLNQVTPRAKHTPKKQVRL
jgi:hypothetical protein